MSWYEWYTYRKSPGKSTPWISRCYFSMFCLSKDLEIKLLIFSINFTIMINSTEVSKVFSTTRHVLFLRSSKNRITWCMEAPKKCEFHESKCTVLLGEDRNPLKKTINFRRVENNAKHLKWRMSPRNQKGKHPEHLFFFTFKPFDFKNKNIQAVAKKSL